MTPLRDGVLWDWATKFRREHVPFFEGLPRVVSCRVVSRRVAPNKRAVLAHLFNSLPFLFYTLFMSLSLKSPFRFVETECNEILCDFIVPMEFLNFLTLSWLLQ